MTNWTEEELKAKLDENPYLMISQAREVIGKAYALRIDDKIMHPEESEKPHKYHVADKEKRTYNGHTFHSRKEMLHAIDNDTKIRAGILSFYLIQVPFRLPGEITYRADFAEFTKVSNTCLYEVRFVDVKGYDTPVSSLKRKQVSAIYGIEIEVV